MDSLDDLALQKARSAVELAGAARRADALEDVVETVVARLRAAADELVKAQETRVRNRSHARIDSSLT